MPQIEIDESELSGLRQLQQTVQKWMGNPAARQKILEAQKTINPDAVIPEIDAAKPIKDAMDKLDQRFSDFEKRLNEDKEEREKAKKLSELNSRWEKGRNVLRDQGYTAEGIEKIEKLMEERGIADHDAGAALFDRLNPPEQPIMPDNSGFGMLTEAFTPSGDANAEADRKLLFDNPDAWLNKTLTDTFKDIRKK